MYKLLLCWRYLRTRFLAVICIVSVMLGVATLIVVNSVMSGFSTKLRDRLRETLSDIVVETPNYNGFSYTDEEMMRRISESPAGPKIAAMTPTIEVVAMMNFEVDLGPQFMFAERQKITRPVRLLGIDPKGRAAIGGFAEHLVTPAEVDIPGHPDQKYVKPVPDLERQADPSFRLSPAAQAWFEWQNPLPPEPLVVPPEGWQPGVPLPEAPPPQPRDPKGCIVGFAIATYRDKHPLLPKEIDRFILNPGDTINILTVGMGKKEIQPIYSPFVVAGYMKTEMAEYDSSYVYVPLDYLQEIRGTPGRSTHIQIKLHDYADAEFVTTELKKIFPNTYNQFQVSTWEEKQGTLLAAIAVERKILNMLLFMIIGVAGFSILAIFSMIVVEKTRDIGILKSLGASDLGIMSIFLSYGFLLGLVGSVLGTIAGLTITKYINEIEGWLSGIVGQSLFPANIYYFDKIPTNVDAMSVVAVNLGAIFVAVLFSVLPALRAALLPPVRALRYE